MPASNSLITSSLALKMTLRALRNSWTLVNRAAKSTDELFKNGTFKSGTTVNVKIPPRYVSGTGSTLVKNNTDMGSVPMTVIQRNAGTGFTSQQLSLSISDFDRDVAQPLAAQLAADIEADGYAELARGAEMLATPGAMVAGRPAAFTGAEITSLRVFNDARARILEEAGASKMHGALSPATHGALTAANAAVFNPSSAIAEQYLMGTIAKYAGIEFVETQSIPSFTTGTRGVGPFTITTASHGASIGSASVLGLSGLAAGATVVRGDTFTIPGVFAINPLTRVSTGKLRVFTVQADAVANGSGVISGLQVTPRMVASGKDQTVTALPVAGTSQATFVGAANVSTEVNLVWNDDALMFAAPTLTTDMPGVSCTLERDPANGFALRIMTGTDITEDERVQRVDTQYAWKVVRGNLACRVLG